MGCGGSFGIRTGRAPTGDSNTDLLNLRLLNEQLEDLFTFKVLLLGAGESGKSTIVKQLRLIHNHKLSKSELQLASDSLHQNTLDCLRALIDACGELGIQFDSDEHEGLAKLVVERDNGKPISKEFARKMLELYHSDAIKRALDRRNEFWLLDACDYYFEHLNRFVEDGFEPNERDVVMARVIWIT